MLAIAAIQYWLSLRFRNFVVALGIGFALYITGLTIRQWEHIDWYPYMYPFLVYFPNPGLARGTAEKVLSLSWLWAGAITALAFLDITNRRTRG